MKVFNLFQISAQTNVDFRRILSAITQLGLTALSALTQLQLSLINV